MTIKIIKPYQGKPEEFSQSFDKDKIFVNIDDEKINVYEKIQAANVDTDLRQVMIKYGCKREQGVEFMSRWAKSREGFFGDFTMFQTGAIGENVIEGNLKMQKFWKKLPLELRKKLNNDMEIDPKIAKPLIEEYFNEKFGKQEVKDETRSNAQPSADGVDTAK